MQIMCRGDLNNQKVYFNLNTFKLQTSFEKGKLNNI